MKQIPEVGKTYKFYDDGKIRESRQYNATVIRVVPKKNSIRIHFPAWYNYWNDYEISTIVQHPDYGKPMHSLSLYGIWKTHVKECDWVFAEDTDYLIECDIPDYDENHIWFARTKEGGWFSMNIQSNWQGGLLDVDGSLTNNIK